MSDKPRAKVFIATPMYGGMCHGSYTQSLILLQAALAQSGIPAAIGFMFNESLITRARNALARQFLGSDCTHLLFIDSDIRFDAADVLKMFAADKELLCGIYPKKEINWPAVAAAVQKGIPAEQLGRHTGACVVNLVGHEASVTVPAGEPLEIWAGGTGMMLIKREVLDALAPHVPSYRTDDASPAATGGEIKEFFATSIDPETRRLLSEDYHFCRLWRMRGGKVFAAPWMRLGHVGSYAFEGALAPAG